MSTAARIDLLIADLRHLLDDVVAIRALLDHEHPLSA